MRRHRASAPPADSSSSSSDNDDAFSAFSSSKKSKRKQKKQQTPNKKTADVNINVNTDATTDATTNTVKDDKKDKNTHTHKDKNTHAHAHIHTPSTNTVKRHHGTSSARQAKMDALLLELENNKNQSNEAGHYGPSGNGGADGNGAGSSSSSRPPPDKRGSFVEEGEEHLTTNIFVGNLAPSVTEEALTDLFRQFGESMIIISTIVVIIFMPMFSLRHNVEKNILLHFKVFFIHHIWNGLLFYSYTCVQASTL